MLTGFSSFVVIIALLLISWSLVIFWQRFLENFFFGTLGYDPTNTWITLWVAILATGIFFLIVWLIKYLEIIPNVDVLIFDYNEEVIIDGDVKRLQGPRRFTGRISPRGALFIS